MDPGSFTTFDQLSALAASGQQVAVYQQPGLGLIDINGRPDGSYDFSLEVFLGAQRADLVFANINSTSLGLSGASLSRIHRLLFLSARLRPADDLSRDGNRDRFAKRSLRSRMPGRRRRGTHQRPRGEIAATATQALAIVAPDTGTGFVAESVSAQPFLQIPRQ